MAMNGIDVSSWQGQIVPSMLDGVEFYIVKATEGQSYVNPYCDFVVNDCVNQLIPWGFYHFGRNTDPMKEAQFFISNCKNYFGAGIPVLDWEDGQDVNWVNAFVRHVHDQTGVWPWIYANPWRFNLGGVEPNCGRWIAHYDKNQRTSLTEKLPDIPKTDGLVCCWQFTSNGRVLGYEGKLDLDRFYGDADAWAAYARGDRKSAKVNVLEDDEYRVTIERR